jgi:hypothetical protein
MIQLNESVGLRVGQRVQDHSENDREDCHVCGDREAERQDRCRRESRGTNEPARRECDLLPKPFKRSRDHRVDGGFAVCRWIAKSESRDTPRFVRGKPASSRIVFEESQMRCELVLQVFVKASPAEDVRDLVEKTHRHSF